MVSKTSKPVSFDSSCIMLVWTVRVSGSRGKGSQGYMWICHRYHPLFQNAVPSFLELSGTRKLRELAPHSLKVALGSSAQHQVLAALGYSWIMKTFFLIPDLRRVQETGCCSSSKGLEPRPRHTNTKDAHSWAWFNNSNVYVATFVPQKHNHSCISF